MARSTAKRTVAPQPAPEPIVGKVKPTATDGASTPKPAPVVPVQKLNVFERAANSIEQRVHDKMAIMGMVRQRLSEANEYFSEGKGRSEEGQKVADKAAVNLYQAQLSGLITKEEVSATLGDVFGFKPKTDGTPGKTPMAEGEAIRKRVVRAVQAAEYVTNGDGGSFFEGLPEDDIASIVQGLEDEQFSIWTAYEMFAQVKREHAIKTNAAFDPKKIAAIVEALSAEGAADIVRASEALVAAYGALVSVLTVIGETPEDIPAE